MEIIFIDKHREYKATVENVEDIYEAVRDGMVAMSYHINTANEVKEALETLEEEEENE